MPSDSYKRQRRGHDRSIGVMTRTAGLPSDTEVGERYRLAHQLAARLSERLMSMPPSDVRAYLRRFYRAGQEGKIALAQAP